MVESSLESNKKGGIPMTATAKFGVRDMALVAMMTALMAICAWISIPTTVPVTLQTLGVFLSCALLGGKRGALAVFVYILLGGLGLPVFAGFNGGAGALLGSTGGYILGFLLQALVMWGMEALWGRDTWWKLTAAMLLGLLACYAAGTAWFMVVYTQASGPVGLWTVLGWCVIPFVVPDLIKLALALLLQRRIGRYVG